MFKLMHKLVKIIIANPDWIFGCVGESVCVRNPTENPHGIPVWMMFSFDFWTFDSHPLGAGWTLDPEPYGLAGYNPNYYLGYSVEPNCLGHPFVPLEERKNQVYVFGKSSHYFYGSESSWTPDFYDEATEATGLSFIVGIYSDDPEEQIMLPKGVVNFGVLPPKNFSALLAHSRMLIGVGGPWT